MKNTLLALATAVALGGLATAAGAQDITRTVTLPTDPIALVVKIPPGYTTYYFTGEIGKPLTPATDGKPAVWGDATQSTRSALETLKATMAKEGVTFGDVVRATVYLGPKLGPTTDFAAMNAVWKTYFGTPEQPNKPARVTIHVDQMGSVGPQVQIDLIAAKK